MLHHEAFGYILPLLHCRDNVNLKEEATISRILLFRICSFYFRGYSSVRSGFNEESGNGRYLVVKYQLILKLSFFLKK